MIWNISFSFEYCSKEEKEMLKFLNLEYIENVVYNDFFINGNSYGYEIIKNLYTRQPTMKPMYKNKIIFWPDKFGEIEIEQTRFRKYDSIAEFSFEVRCSEHVYIEIKFKVPIQPDIISFEKYKEYEKLLNL